MNEKQLEQQQQQLSNNLTSSSSPVDPRLTAPSQPVITNHIPSLNNHVNYPVCAHAVTQNQSDSQSVENTHLLSNMMLTCFSNLITNYLVKTLHPPP